MVDRNGIREALARLMTRENRDAFLIFEDPATKRFVQFAGGAGQSLIFDLPTNLLSPEEVAAARSVLEPLGAQFDEWEGEGPDGRPKMFGAFGLDLGKDIAAGAELAWIVLKRVYRLEEPFAVELKEN